jgi:hypothetical protein
MTNFHIAFSSALILFGALVALKRHKMQCSTYTTGQLLKYLHMASKALEELGNGTRLFARASKIFKEIMKIASLVATTPSEPGLETSSAHDPATRLHLQTSLAAEAETVKGMDSQGFPNSAEITEVSFFDFDAAFDSSWLENYMTDPLMSYNGLD